MKLGPVPMIKAPFPCLDFIDSEFADHLGGRTKFDRLAMPEWQRWFLDRWGWLAPLPAPAAQLARLYRARPLVRAVLEPGGDVAGLDALLARAPFVYQAAASGGLKPVPLHEGWDAVLARVAISAIELAGGPDADRVKVCSNPDCSWMFFDASLNRSRRWCQANVCGNLIKVRAHRASRRGGAPNPA